ncbi:unnamed protein product [Linum trigynum]|uniref:GATA transcription factor n=1 Tax=Linum trigynum TaxID=586398 RepID=A0AAV2DY19_9ROSI
MEAPEYYMSGYFGAGVPATFADYSPEKNQKLPSDPSHFVVDDLLDFPNDDDAIMTDGFFDNIAKNCATATADSPAFTSNDSCNSSSTSAGANPAAYQSFADSHFSSELCVPYDDMAELEWLSNFVDDSFSADQTYNLHMLPGSKPHTPDSSSCDTQLEPMGRNMNHPMFQPDTPLPGKARSKRSRAAPGNWTTRLLHLASPSGKGASKKQQQPQQQQEGPAQNPSSSGSGSDAIVRRCLHCGSEKTPQWRTGPMGPKTLCNACGVRYKSGRLVPEYRPAASPTFVPAKHSNSHRKVLELRRQRELHAAAQQEQYLNPSSYFGVPNGGDEFLVHHHHHRHHHPGGPNFTQMI